MPFMTSIELLQIGIATVDSEHAELFAILKRFQAEVEGYRRRGVKNSLLNELAQKAIAHFLSEERLMAEAHYPGLALHAVKHEHLLEKLTAMRARYNRGKSRLDRHALHFLFDWFSIHIQTDDAYFALWLHEHELPHEMPREMPRELALPQSH